MNVLQMLRSRKYLQRIMLSFMPVVAMLAIASLVLNSVARDKVLSLQNDADRKLLTQLNYNIENMNGIVKDLAVSLYNDEEMIALKSGGDYKQSILKIERLNKTVATSPYLHAIVFYNGKQKRFFSSINHGMDNGQLYGALEKIMASGGDLPKLQLLPLDLDGGNEGIDVFAFFVYDGLTLGSVNDDVLILTVKPGWMLDNLKALNRVVDRENDMLFVTDGEGRLLMSNDRSLPAGLDTKDILGRIAGSEHSLDSFIYAQEGSKYKVTFLSKALNNWQIISLQDYDDVSGSVRQMRWTEIAVTLSVALLAVLLSVFFAMRLYKPVGHLLTLVPPGGLPAAHAKDELSLIADNVAEMLGKLKGLEQERASQWNIAKLYHLRSLISLSESLEEPAFLKLKAQYGIDIAYPSPLRLALVQIDDARELAKQQGSGAESLLYFAVANIGQELLGNGGSCEAADMKSGHLVFIVGGEPEALEKLGDRFGELQNTILRYYRITFTVTLSGVFEDYRRLTEHYNLAVRRSNYRMIFGKGAILEPDRLHANETNEAFRVPQELERRLTEGLKSGDPEEAELAIRSWIRLLGGFSFENMYSGLLHLTVALSNTLGEMNHHNANPVSVNLQAINRRILEQETLDEIEAVLLEVVREVLEQRRSGRENKNRLLADTVKEIIDKHYADPDLNVQRIADMLKLSSVHLGQVYKAEEGLSVVDRINEVRLAQARLYLEQQQLTVAEIMEKVGFGNESYFYRLFKRRYGATPKEYRLKAAIDRNT
ncbi:AraC family transcriptional regulator [Paenibacillus timonensis]|jgi:AraC-like DNA-binding protein|uniref:Helix-turn-helix transcriptional regulator n=1 Tax=Paenibacillus timonensis TaxID=225915 RepID=A0ABW3S954_9BACL|nr:AraC family transcriptional regulator [Paenibacillus timonensis]MCH1639417.1 AraC family transcriptional regulator [Paenibacillus timonensis]